MLENYGLHELVWDACDERFNDILVASPADAKGRGISLTVRESGAVADMTRATVYFIWRRKTTGERGTEPFEALDASAGTFEVFYPAAMCEAAGPVQAQVMVSRGDIGKYQGLGFTPWTGTAGSTHRQYLTAVTFVSDMSLYQTLRLDYLLYSCTAIASVSGLGNLSGVTSMRFTFSSCSGLTELDFGGFDPSSLTDLYYAFGGASALTTIYADASWVLPSSGISGSSCFYNCRNLVGGNGTAWASSKTGYAYFRIDRAGQEGYLTAA